MQEQEPRTINGSTQDNRASAWRPRLGSRIVVPGRLLDGSISDQSVRVFAGVAELDYTADGCYMAITNLAARLGVDRGTVHRCLTELAASGFIYRSRTRDGRDSWKIRPFAMSPQAGGYALIWPTAVKRIVSARHFRAYALCVREHDRPHGRPITAALVAASLVNLGPSDGRGRRQPKPVSSDTAQRTLNDLAEARWLVADRENRSGLPVLYTPQASGFHDVTRDFRSAERRAERAAAESRHLAQLAAQEPAQQPAEERADETGAERDAQSAPDEGTREGADQRGGDASGDIHSPSPASAAPGGPGASLDPMNEEDPQVTAVSPPDDIHSPPQPEHTVTGQSSDHPAQRCDNPSPQPCDDTLRNRDALEGLARRASPEHLTQIPGVRNGPAGDARAGDAHFSDDNGGRDGGAATDPPDVRDRERPPAAETSSPAGERPAGGLLDVDGVPLRERLEISRRSGPGTRQGRLGPVRSVPAVTVAQLRRRLEGVESAHGGRPRGHGGPGGAGERVA